MFDKTKIESLVQDLLKAVPDGIKEAPKELERNFREILKSAFERLDLVTRDEFETQLQILERLQKRLAHLEKALQELEHPPEK